MTDMTKNLTEPLLNIRSLLSRCKTKQTKLNCNISLSRVNQPIQKWIKKSNFFLPFSFGIEGVGHLNGTSVSAAVIVSKREGGGRMFASAVAKRKETKKSEEKQ